MEVLTYIVNGIEKDRGDNMNHVKRSIGACAYGGGYQCCGKWC